MEDDSINAPQKNEEEEEDPSPPSKKVRLFSAKEFRQTLLTPDRQTALREFLELCQDPESFRYIRDYLENGGSCLELFQLLETSTEVPASLVLKVAHYVLYQIATNHARFHSATYEGCRYFLNTHLALVNKMLSLSSTTEERKLILKLLTVIVTFSSTLAKEILLHVNFNPTNMEVLLKQTGGTGTMRNLFIHFLVAFLVEGEYTTISALLEKKWLLTSIVKGLQYDPAETVTMVMLTLKTNILENTLVSKTRKMGIFNTLVIKDIVNLYNWKGPRGIKDNKKVAEVPVNEHDKASVNESVHNFLLVLCTSHRLGVIFKDHQLGLGKKTHNSLMYTVLESLNKPWEHSYAGELVIKICGACPDLVKTVWASLKTFLELRATPQWLSAIKFAMVLAKELEPSAIEFCAREVTVFQLTQVIQMLVAPTSILKIVAPENYALLAPCLRHHVLRLLLEFLKSVQRFINASHKWLKPEDLRALKCALQEHIFRNFLDAQTILRNWTKTDAELGTYSVLEHLELILESLDLYESLCPQLLESLSSVNLQGFLKEIQELPEARSSQIRATKLFISFEPAFFGPKTDLFAETMPKILESYSETKDANAKATLRLLLKNTWIFDGCLEEIDFWIDGVCDLNSYDDSIGENLVQIVNQTTGKIFQYFSQMSKLLETAELVVDKQDLKDVLENLTDDSLQIASFSTKHQTLSPLLLGTLEFALETEQSKSFKSYFGSVLVNLLHFQTSPSLLTAIILNEKYEALIPKHVANYVRNWVIDGNIVVLSKIKPQLAKQFSSSFLEGDVDEFFKNHQEELETDRRQIQNCLRQAVFYFCNLSKENLSEAHVKNCEKVIKHFIPKVSPQELAASIFCHPFLLQSFSPLHAEKNKRTMFLVEIVKEFQNTGEDLGDHLDPYRAKLVASLKKVLNNSKSGKKLIELLEIFGLELKQCLDVLNFCSGLSLEDLELEDSLLFYYNVTVFALKTFMKQLAELEPLNDDVISAVTNLLTFLHKNRDKFDTSACANVFKNYLQVFPHNLENVSAELFESILSKPEFCKENSSLAGFLLAKRPDFLDLFVKSTPNIASKKGLMLILLEAAISIKANDDAFRTAFQHFKPTIMNALQKPQKAGQYFHAYPSVVAELVKKCMPRNVCKLHMEKVEKFEISEPFHVQMLITMFNKSIFDSKEKVSEGHFNNAILTLVHATNSLFKKKSKSDEDSAVLDVIVKLINDEFLEKLVGNKAVADISFRTLCKNESFQLCCKFCLKFALPANPEMLKWLKLIVQLVDFEETEARLLLEMAGSHSEFLEVILNENSVCKVELLDLVLVLCQRWPALMERNHVPVLLAAYQATVKPSDRIILTLLQMYEKAANKTNFYDFKPFLWGTAAATHYSVRQDMQKSLWRQPKMSTILDILQREWVHNTLNHYPLDLTLTANKDISLHKDVYDLAFLIPMFSSLLAHENKASTYTFVRSGGLSLTIVALGSNSKDLRLAACNVLARLHFHVEATQDKKGRFLWIRFIEAVCRGTAALEDCKLNNFSAIFWARMALILTDPTQALYMPLSNYLASREAPDLSGVPELYTFLHGAAVNYKQTRMFILEILRDGMRTDHDFTVAFRAVAFKLIMELFVSCVVDLDTKILILEILERACKLKEGIKFLCSNCGLLSWLYDVLENLHAAEENLLPSVIQILRTITTNKSDLKLINCSIVGLIIASVVDKNLISRLRKQEFGSFLQIIVNVFDEINKFITEDRLRTLVAVSNSRKCSYFLKHGCKYVAVSNNCVEVEDYILLVLSNWNKIQ